MLLKIIAPRKTVLVGIHSNSASQKLRFSSKPKGKNPNRAKTLRECKVPSGKVERAVGFASVAASIFINTLGNSVKNKIIGKPFSVTSNIASEHNILKFTETLCRMRGAALKIGQMISLQEKFLPPEVAKVLAKVRDSAHILPAEQIRHVLVEEYGEDWESKFESFDLKPFAAASIGQVHKAKLKNGEELAVKVQYPNIGKSIDSDLNNLELIVNNFQIFPKGLYIDNIIKAARVELAREIQYDLEAKKQKRMAKLFKGYPRVHIPKVYDELSTKHILAVEFVEGEPIDKLVDLPQEEKNKIAEILLNVTLKELFQFYFMQTDPNWSNFLYDTNTKTLNLIDFGAAREYEKPFTDRYIQMVFACVEKRDEHILKHSDALGFTTGYETKKLKALHLKSAYALGEPFRHKSYDFGKDDITKKITKYGGEMLNDRLTPPPEEAYTLHRKLSGFFLSCVKLEAQLECRDIFLKRYKNYDWKGVEKDK